MQRRVVIHGATNINNFGDALFAHLFYHECATLNDCEPFFLQMHYGGVGPYIRNELNYTKKLSFIGFLKSHALVLMSGGYLGDNAKSLKSTLKRYIRYVLPARLFQLIRKPVYVLGVGGGPIDSRFLRKSIVRLLNKAETVYVRDVETQQYFCKYGVKKNIAVTTDTAQVITADMLPEFCLEADIKSFFRERRIIFMHLIASEKVDSQLAHLIVPALNAFLENHAEYGVIVATDGNIDNISIKNLEAFKALRCERVLPYQYTNSWQLCALLNRVDFIITPKLHVGIVSAALGKAVVSFPVHREKTQRYYKQIGEAERCLHISEVSVNKAHKIMEEFHNVPIFLSDEIREMARQNLQILHSITEISEGKV